VFLKGKTGYTRTRGRRTRTRPDPWRYVRHLPDPTRTRGYGSGRVYPRVRVDLHTSKMRPWIWIIIAKLQRISRQW